MVRLSNLAKQYVKVVLSGEGADELFADYNEYEEMPLFKLYKMLPFSLRRMLYLKNKDKNHFRGKTIIMKYGQNVEERYIGQAKIMSDAEANDILIDEYKKQYSLSRAYKKILF